MLSVKSEFLWNFNFEKGIKSITPRRRRPQLFAPNEKSKRQKRGHFTSTLYYPTSLSVAAMKTEKKSSSVKSFRDSFSCETGLTDFIPRLYPHVCVHWSTYVLTGHIYTHVNSLAPTESYSNCFFFVVFSISTK